MTRPIQRELRKWQRLPRNTFTGELWIDNKYHNDCIIATVSVTELDDRIVLEERGYRYILWRTEFKR